MNRDVEHAGSQEIRITKVLLSASTALSLENEQLAGILECDMGFVISMRQNGSGIKVGSRRWELALMVIRLHSQLAERFSNNRAAINRYLSAFDATLKAKPRDLLCSDSGLRRVYHHALKSAPIQT